MGVGLPARLSLPLPRRLARGARDHALNGVCSPSFVDAWTVGAWSRTVDRV